MAPSPTTLLDIVAAERLLMPARLASANRRALATGEALVAVLVDVERVPEDLLADAIGRHLGRPLRPIGDVDDEALREVPYDLARSRRLVPLETDVATDGARVLRIAMADPTDRATIAEIELATATRVEPVLARLSEVDDALRRAYRSIITAVMGPPEEAPRRRPPERSPERPPERPPERRPENDLPLETRHRALLELLVAKGVITLDEFRRELRRLVTSGR